MKKIFTALILTTAFILLFVSCGENFKMDIQALADDIIEKSAFTDEPVRRKDDTITSRYLVGTYVNAVSYATGGATAEEIAIFEAENENQANEIYKKMQSYLSSQTRSYESYNPAGVVNLKKAILELKGKYVIYCVCADEAAANGVVAEYLNK